MNQFDPEWTERIDTGGRPRDPLGSNRARNRSVRLYARSLRTNNTLRLRYVSLFAWFLSELNQREQLINRQDLSKTSLIKDFEKLMVLSSLYHRLDQEQDKEVVRGITGVGRLGDYDSIYKFKNLHFNDIELQKNDGYGYVLYERIMQNLFIKRGDYELTGVGEALADAVGENLDSNSDELLDIVYAGSITRQDFDQHAHLLAIQSIYTRPEDFATERKVLQKVFCGMIEWEGDEIDGTVRIGQSAVSKLDVLGTLYRAQANYETDNENNNPLENHLHANFGEGLHEFQKAFLFFVLRAWELYQPINDNTSFTNHDHEVFDEFRTLMRVYWLQVYAGYAVNAQLEALSTFINKQHPPRYDLETILDEMTNPAVAHATSSALTSISATQTDEDIGGQRFIRNLCLYGESYRTPLEATVRMSPLESFTTLGDVSSFLISERVESNQLKELNEVLLSKSIRTSLNKLNSASPTNAFEHWHTALGRSIALLVFVIKRYHQLAEEAPQLQRYMRRQLWTPPGNSVPLLERYLREFNSDTPLSEIGRKLIRERVIDIHTEVMYKRLTPGNLQRLVSLDRDDAVCLRMDQEPGSRPYIASPSFVRLSETNTMLRDAGFLKRTGTSTYEITSEGKSFLSNVYGESR